MEELNAVEMAWRGSVIQALATIIAALIAAVGLGLGIYASWKTSLELQRKDKIYETRREIYTGFIESYAALMNILYEAISSPDELKDRISYCREARINFNKSLDKTLFVCETKNKKEFVVFIGLFFPKLTYFMEDLTNYFNQQFKHNELEEDYLESFNKYRFLKNKLDEEENLNEAQKHKLNSDVDHLVNIILEKEKYLQISKIEMMNLVKKLKNEFNILNDSSQENFLNVMHLLRQEIGIESDIQLEDELNKTLIKINKDIGKAWE